MKFIGILLLSLSLKASVIAIIDSGTDYRHEALRDFIWKNPGEVKGDLKDNDRNGYIDDLLGWNFAESNNQVIDYRYLDSFSNRPYKFFEIQLKRFKGTATKDELDWIKNTMQDEDARKEMMRFGNFVHGTHVAGIAQDKNPDAKIMSVKLIPTEISLPFFEQGQKFIAEQPGLMDWKYELLKFGLGQLAGLQMQLFEQIGQYVGNLKADVANGSFGTSYHQLEMIVKGAFQLAMDREPDEEELKDLTNHFISTMVRIGRKMLNAADDTLFVFAAGNDSTNNDEYPISPANIKAPNSITVAATFGRDELAPFSNYGLTHVDVAAPGVGIYSAIPGDEYLHVSGTSQAAPYVAAIAARIKDTNPHLAPRDIKSIIMETVDYKQNLFGKVKTGGVVNKDRALFAAKASAELPLHVAINNARQTIKDVETPKMKKTKIVESFVFPLPSPIIVR